MRLVTEQENQEMHLLLDECIGKMNDDKNRYKPHWKTMDLKEIQKMITVENAELDLALYQGVKDGIISEFKDIINCAVFGMHNILKGSLDKL